MLSYTSNYCLSSFNFALKYSVMKKKHQLLVLFLFYSFCIFYLQSANAQLKQSPIPDSLFSAYYHQKVSLFNTLPITNNDIIFLGNSITDGNEWSEILNDIRIKNRGISGDVTSGVIKRINEITNRKPKKIFLLIGINDLSKGVPADSIVKNIFWIADFVKQESPSTQLYVQSILPVDREFKNYKGDVPIAETIKNINTKLNENTAVHAYKFINLHKYFATVNGNMNALYSNDGLHLKGNAYQIWKHIVYPFVYDVQQKPSLIPLPKTIQWKEEYFPMYNTQTIFVNDKLLLKEAWALQKEVEKKGFYLNVAENKKTSLPRIELFINKEIKGEESYALSVNAERIKISAATSHGVFNGIQTLYQLMRDNVLVDACEIQDQPAFDWRGYMVDVGRNYQSMELLKQQIDVMAKYKLNIFHFHGTEDIAWRFASKLYPQLTAAENMIRNKGMFYSEQELKELIQYCKDRYITLIPEIDMPGHSAAFTRAMGTNMQSDSGMMVVKNILNEFIDTYNPPYLHIGGDEVKITNQNFLPEIIKLVQSKGVKTIGWSPGGNIDEKTIRQLWMDDVGRIESSNFSFVDSRHLYLNHMDPFEGVVTIFNRQIGNVDKGNAQMKGAILCLWPDRRVEKEDDAIKMNLVYPGMLAFAERTWRGGGVKGWVANIGSPDEKRTNDFIEFENRLLEHKKINFEGNPFPYMAQQNMKWQLYGPYDNGGDLAKKFEPELKSFNAAKTKAYKEITGATVVLRHWWAPLISGAIDEAAKENSTWYAVTKIWSDKEEVKNFWIGFNNISRSPATDTPPVNAWDEKQSAVWVNGSPVAAPFWKRAGQKGNPEIPLIDEGYEYRAPSKILLQKGWNDVLIKAPIGSFKGKNWQNPVKWMFTFIEAE